MDRRSFLALSALSTLNACRGPKHDGPLILPTLRLFHTRFGEKSRRDPSVFAAVDAQSLLNRVVSNVTLSAASPTQTWQQSDVLIGVLGDHNAMMSPASDLEGIGEGGYQLSAGEQGGPSVVIIGVDIEGARNGIYRWLETLGFGFFIDGETIPESLPAALGVTTTPLQEAPRFKLRGEMFWNCYLGPRQFNVSAWGLAEWERALLFLVRKRMNFIEFYPPQGHLTAQAFPEAPHLQEKTWRAREVFELTRAVLKRGRQLGITFMYVLTYGRFPEEVRTAHKELEWAGDFLCAHQPELKTLTARMLKVLIDELGTDHMYAIRHRGEEGQSYSNPCSTTTKAAGMIQALEVLEKIDPGCRVTVWTWSEDVPKLFAALPDRVEAVHIRHGMGKIFTSSPEGREQSYGSAADMPTPRKWLSAQFTVFGGHETLLQTAWSDPRALAKDARACAKDPLCGGFFQWPEWAATSPWLSQIISELGWDPVQFESADALHRYARQRHGVGEKRDAFLRAFTVLIKAGNASFMATPSKRLLVPYLLERNQHGLLLALKTELRGMVKVMGEAPESPLFDRDVIDLALLVGVKLAHSWEVAGCVCFANDNREGAQDAANEALRTWDELEAMLEEVPSRSLAQTVGAMASEGPLDNLLESFIADTFFYKGYPLVWSPEGIRGAYRPQCLALLKEFKTAADAQALPTFSRDAKWFWRDFPDSSWTEGVRLMPDIDQENFKKMLTSELAAAIKVNQSLDRPASLKASRLARGEISPATLMVRDRKRVIKSAGLIATQPLPPMLEKAPRWPPMP